MIPFGLWKGFHVFPKNNVETFPLLLNAYYRRIILSSIGKCNSITL